MKTQIIRVSGWDAAKGGHTVELFVEGASADWLTRPVAGHVASFGKSLPGKGAAKPDDPLSGPRVAKVLDLAAGDPAKMEILERALGAFLFDGPVGEEFRDGSHPHRGAGTWRTYLDVRDPVLAGLPWERMVRLVGPAVRYMFAIPGYPMSRMGRVLHFVTSTPADEEPIWPLKILIVVGSEPNDPAVRAEEEVIAIKRALRRDVGRMLIVEVSKRPAKDPFFDLLKDFRPHVLHFVGHGRYDAVGKDSLLEFRPEKATDNWSWRAKDIPTDLAPYCPRFVFLNACHSSEPTTRAMAVALSDAMLAAGARAVLGMRAPINGAAAALLAEEFYVRLAHGEPLDDCLVHARRRVTNDNNFPLDEPEWSTPCLEFGWFEEAVLPLCPAGRAKAEQILSDHDHLGELHAIVDRSDQRQDLLYTIAPALRPKTPTNVFLITGAEKAGKSVLARWSLERFGVVGCKLHYVHFPDQGSTNFVDFLRAIRDGSQGGDRSGCGPACPSLPPAAFHEFNRRLNFFLRGENPKDVGGNSSDDRLPWRALDEGVITQIVTDFRLALTAAAGADSLVVVLDNVDVVRNQFSAYVIPFLVRPLAKAADPRVRLVFVLSEKREAEHGLNDPSLPLRRVPLKNFDKDEFRSLMREYLRLRGTFSPAADTMIDVTAATKITGSWPASWFDQIGYIADILK
jgi:hypothetical protein